MELLENSREKVLSIESETKGFEIKSIDLSNFAYLSGRFYTDVVLRVSKEGKNGKLKTSNAHMRIVYKYCPLCGMKLNP